ncbi:MAG: CapA family protein [Elusimicrobia bacterium]|nr:CapA family protein [Elusimicrobiota bacterium]
MAAPAAAQEDARLLFTGDIMLARQVETQLESAGASPWDKTGDLLKQAAFVMGNFEGAAGPSSACAGKTPCFAVNPKYIPLLREAGFSAMGIENNHALDLGPAGRADTKRALMEAGVAPVDFEGSPWFFRAGNKVLAVIAADDTGATASKVLLRRKLRLAKALGNVTAVSVHWGQELSGWLTPRQLELSGWLSANGADLLAGHHPHVPEAARCVNGRPVFFSLGNHVFDQKYPAAKQGVIADCLANETAMSCSALKTQTPSGSFFPSIIGPDSEAGDELKKCPVPLRLALAVGGYELRPELENGHASAGKIALRAFRDGRPLWRTPAKKLFSAQKMTDASGKEMLLLLEEHYSPLDKEYAPRPYVYEVTVNGLNAKWRGTALAWPLLDAVLLDSSDGQFLCALHRGDSFLAPEPSAKKTRTAAYIWNGFGFSGTEDPAKAKDCAAYYELEPPAGQAGEKVGEKLK